MRTKQFYSELGKLLYSIADSNGSISKSERKILKDLVQKELAPAEKGRDEFGTDTAFYTEIEFDIMEDSITEPRVAFDSFINFIENHKTAIDRRMIEVSRSIATRVADVHYKNRMAKELLETLNRKLNALLKEKRNPSLNHLKHQPLAIR